MASIPGGGSYAISYEQTPGLSSTYTTGRIATLTLPSGGSISYSYSGGNNGINCASGVVPTLQITVNDNNGNVGQWKYVNNNSSSTPGNFTVTVTDPPGNQTVYSFSGQYQTEAMYYQGSASGTPLKTVLTCYNGNLSSCAAPSSVPSAPINKTDVRTTLNASLASRATTTFDSYGNPLVVSQYDFGGTLTSPTGALLSSTTYVYGRSYSSPTACNPYPSGTYIYGTPCYVHIANSGDVSETKTSYNADGKPASVSRWTGAKENTWLTTSFGYGASGAAAGVLSSITDANNTTTSFSNFQCNGMFAGSTTYPISTVGSGSQTWDCNGGVVSSYTDVNNNTTNYCYNNTGACSFVSAADPLYRLKGILHPDGGTITYSYNTGSGRPWTKLITTAVSSSQSSTTKTALDGLGRAVLASGSTYSTSTDPNNTSTQVRYGGVVYNNLAQVAKSYNPYFTTSDSTYGYTSYTYDALGRPTQVTSPSGLETQYTYNGRATEEVRFPNNNKFTKIYQVDGLGRLVDVCELTTVTQASNKPPYPCSLDITPDTGFLSTVTYDPLGNVLTMGKDIPAQTRTMVYDGLSRLTSITTPEAGLTSYTYDTGSLGDLYQSVAPLPNNSTGSETITYAFDSMHRLTSKSYSDGTTPGLAIAYDQSAVPSAWGGTALSNGKGRVSWLNATNFTGVDAVFGYDPMGRVNAYGQCAPVGCNNGTHFITTYNYDYIGDVLNGNNILNNFVWTNTYNAIGELTQVYTGMLTNTSAGDLVSGIAYNALGEPTSDLLGNGEQESWTYNADGVATDYSVGSGPVFDWNLTVSTGVISASNDNQYFGQVYTYDDFGRLATMKGAGGLGWGFSYGYDQFGNRWNQTVTQGSGPSPSYTFSSVTPSIPNTNHIITGVTYDDAGNMTYDGFYYYTYDGNNRVIKIGTTSGSSNVASFAYNSRGMRVSNSFPGASTEWMFDLSGNLLTVSVPGTTQFYEAEYFVGGRNWGTLAQGSTNFRYSDWVGNGRVWQNVAGTVTQQGAYASFGDGLFPPGNGTCCWLPSGLYDGAWQDSGSNTYHTLNREYSPTQGRWLRPDPAALTAMDLRSPQTWNSYLYVADNPIGFSDPTGLGGPNQCSDQNSPAICQPGSVNPFTNSLGMWDPLEIGFWAFESDGERDLGLFVPYGTFFGQQNRASSNPANKGKLTPAQCKAAQTLLAREAQYGTSIAAYMSAIGFGDNIQLTR